MTIKEEKEMTLDAPECLIPERIGVTDALLTFATSSGEDRKHRVCQVLELDGNILMLLQREERSAKWYL
jgi:hypothetical protein